MGGFILLKGETMAEPVFCTLEDVQAREPDILDLAPISGHINVQLAAARTEIEDRLLTSLVLLDLDKLGPTIEPPQLRLPSIYKTLEIIYCSNFKDEDSPYFVKYEKYRDLFTAAFTSIKTLDLDSDEDGVLEDNEKNVLKVWTGRMRRV